MKFAAVFNLIFWLQQFLGKGAQGVDDGTVG